MPRIARIVGPGFPHHIVQRGNNREKVFWDNRDYERYLSFLAKYSGEKSATVHAYCIMPNHVHLLITPPRARDPCQDDAGPHPLLYAIL